MSQSDRSIHAGLAGGCEEPAWKQGARLVGVAQRMQLSPANPAVRSGVSLGLHSTS